MTAPNAARFTCPACGCTGSVEAFSQHADAAAVMTMMGELPPSVATAMQQYLRLFAPEKQEITWTRMARLLSALMPLLTAQSITVNGRSWPAPPNAWCAAVATMVASKTLRRPTNHKYLLAVIAGQAEKARDAGKAPPPAGSAPVAGVAAQLAGIGADAVAAAPDRQQVRNAVAFVTAEATSMRTRFGQQLTMAEAEELLQRRGFDDGVIRAALEEWQPKTPTRGTE